MFNKFMNKAQGDPMVFVKVPKLWGVSTINNGNSGFVILVDNPITTRPNNNFHNPIWGTRVSLSILERATISASVVLWEVATCFFENQSN